MVGSSLGQPRGQSIIKTSELVWTHGGLFLGRMRRGWGWVREDSRRHPQTRKFLAGVWFMGQLQEAYAQVLPALYPWYMGPNRWRPDDPGSCCLTESQAFILHIACPSFGGLQSFEPRDSPSCSGGKPLGLQSRMALGFFRRLVFRRHRSARGIERHWAAGPAMGNVNRIRESYTALLNATTRPDFGVGKRPLTRRTRHFPCSCSHA